MAKKKSHKKHSFKYGEPVKNVDNYVTSKPAKAMTTTDTQEVARVAENPYLKGDMTRLGVLAVSLVAAELVLWYLVGHTGIGNSIYSLYNIPK